MKISIIYFSKSGNTQEMAKEITKGILLENKNIEVKEFLIDDIDYQFLETSSAVIFGTPTIYANTCWQLKKWFDESKEVNLEGKIGSAFATANYAQGGADIAIQTLINHMIVKGMLVYSGGSALGQPYIHLGAVTLKENFDSSKKMFQVLGQRIAKKSLDLFQ